VNKSIMRATLPHATTPLARLLGPLRKAGRAGSPSASATALAARHCCSKVR
jgi:hypothetical protein